MKEKEKDTIVNEVPGSTFSIVNEFDCANNAVGGSAFQNAGSDKSHRKNSSLKDDLSDEASSSSDEEKEEVNPCNKFFSSSDEDSDSDESGDDSGDEKRDSEGEKRDGDGEKRDSDNNNDDNDSSDKQNSADDDQKKEDDDSKEDSPELDDTEVKDFDQENPQKTSNKVGIIAENAHNVIGYYAAKKLFRLVIQNPVLFLGVIPMVFPGAGVIIAILLEDVKNQYKLKKESCAMSEMRTDGYCWCWKGKYTHPDTKITRSYWWAKDDDGNPTEAFKRYQFIYKNKYMILQYVGNEVYASDGLKHGNSKYNTNAYRKTRKSSLLALLKCGKNQLPNKTWELWKKTNGDLSLVTDPRNKEQVRNRRKAAQREARFGKNTLYNLSILGSELVYNVGNNLYSFITYLNLTPFNVCLHLVCAPLLEEMLKTMTDYDVVSEIFYDTGFDFGPYYLSVLSWRHPYFNKIVILAAYLHDRKSRPGHRFFFDEIFRQFEPLFRKIKGKFLLVTDAEFNFLHCWIYLNTVHCYRHQRKNLEWNLKQANSKEIVKCLTLLDEVQKQPTTEECDEVIRRALEEIKSNSDKRLFAKSADKVKKESYAGLLRQYGSSATTLLSNIAESVNAMITNHKQRKNVEADQMVCLLFYLTNDQRRNIIRGYYGEGEFVLIPAYGNKKKGTPKMLKEIVLPYSPESNGICNFLKTESQLPQDHSMTLKGPLILKSCFVGEFFFVFTYLNMICRIYLNLDPTKIPDFGEGDAVKDRRKRRPASEGGKPGHKKPRPIDKKDERDNTNQDDGDVEDVLSPTINDNDDVKCLEPEKEKELKFLPRDEELPTVAAEVKQQYLSNKYPPPREISESQYPEWWNEFTSAAESILFHFQIFIPTFDRPLRNLPIGKACIFQTYKEFYVLGYRKSNNEMVAYVAKHNIDPDSTKEIAFTAAQCCRDTDSTSVNVQGFFCDEIEQNADPFKILLSKIAILVSNEKPEEWALNLESLVDFSEETMQAIKKTKKKFWLQQMNFRR